MAFPFNFAIRVVEDMKEKEVIVVEENLWGPHLGHSLLVHVFHESNNGCSNVK